VAEVDDSDLDGLDPFDALDREAARIDAWLSALPAAGWGAPTRCDGWTVRDLLGHLASSEAYHHACLDGRASELLASLLERGATDLEAMNALGVADFADRSADGVLAEWRSANTETRLGFRAHGDGRIDTSIGDYPNRWQAFHVAGELAVHADDLGVPETPDEHGERQAWRVPFSRFALKESKPALDVSVAGNRTRVAGDGVEVEVTGDELVEGVAGRLDETSRLDAREQALLSTMP
jgi:uncharacterized protein (TIGR03083 family)